MSLVIVIVTGVIIVNASNDGLGPWGFLLSSQSERLRKCWQTEKWLTTFCFGSTQRRKLFNSCLLYSLKSGDFFEDLVI